MPETSALFVPPAADGIPAGALDSAARGANALDAWATTPVGRNFLAHALVQLARDGWLRGDPDPVAAWEPVADRPAAVPVPEEPAAPSADATENLVSDITEALTVEIDGKQVPIGNCIWLERYPCGCIAAFVVAVAGGRAIATAEQAMRHFNPTDYDRQQAERTGRTAFPVTGATYRADYRATDWCCARHTTT